MNLEDERKPPIIKDKDIINLFGSDPYGYAVGYDVTPYPEFVTDCCLLNINEKPDDASLSRTEKPWKLGCKVPNHNGALAEGWETNSKYAQSWDAIKGLILCFLNIF